MLASRLETIARDLVGEYSRFNLIALLQRAASLSANRSSLDQDQYQTEAASLKNAAQRIMDTNIFRTYPLDTLKVISSSELSGIMPANVARVIIAGFPENKSSAISSAELSIYTGESQRIFNEINGFLAFTKSLGVESYPVPDEKVALDLKLTRESFENDLGSFARSVSEFDDLFQILTELTTGSREDVKIIYVSTTDPILSLAFVPAAALAGLLFYKLLLEIAEKQLNILKLIRDFKKSGLGTDADTGWHEKLRSMVTEETTKAVENITSKTEIKVDEGRINELKTELRKAALIVIPSIASGSRLFLSLESQDQIALLTTEAMDEEQIEAEIEQQKLQEAKLDTLLLEDRAGVRELLSSEVSKPD